MELEDIKVSSGKGLSLESRILKIPLADAVEMLLFTILLAAALGAIFRIRFLYIVFAMVAVLMVIECWQRGKERDRLEKKIDDALLRKRKEASI